MFTPGPVAAEKGHLSMKTSWDQRYSDPGYLFGTEPAEWLVAQGPRLRPGMRALALGDGEGRNGVWLARQGLEVTAVDLSPAAQAKARTLATSHGVTLDLVQADLAQWSWPVGAYDVVIVFFVHFPPSQRPRLLDHMATALCRGGLLVMEVFHRQQAAADNAGPGDPAMLYTCAELGRAFGGLDIIHLARVQTAVVEQGRNKGRAQAIRLLARRPDGD